MKYDFKQIEESWQTYWAKHQTFHAPNPGQDGFDPNKPKFYVLDMFPYPSGVGLHVGHPLGYIATDIVARYKRMTGHAVLHPMGYDAFGLPAEQFAVEHNVHPAITTEKNIANMTRQLKELGLSYDWDRSFATTDPGYYRWTQWIFLKLYNSWFDPAQNSAKPIDDLIQRLAGEQLFVSPDGELVEPDGGGALDAVGGTPIGVRKWHELTEQEQRDLLDDHRLAYVSDADVNWCPALGTVLANEEVTQDGRSERGNHPVYKRPLRQWMLRITAYCERLIAGLDNVDWPEPIKIMQRNWVGRSEGAFVDFSIQDNDQIIRVYTTRPDTLFGATYMVLAPEHPLVKDLATDAQKTAVTNYQTQAQQKTDLDRTTDAQDKTGVFTGAYAINPVNDEKIPIWIADYVLMGYGTGAIMAVPAHDQRDFEFAQTHNLPIRDVVYTPLLAAIKGFHDHYDPAEFDDAEDPADLLADFVGACMNKCGTDYLQAIRLVKGRRDTQEIEPPVTGIEILGPIAGAVSDPIETDTDNLQPSGELIPTSGDRRGTISMIWMDEIQNLIAEDFHALMNDIKHGAMAKRFGAAIEDGGINVNSSHNQCSLDGLPTPQAKKQITQWLTLNACGKHTVQYKLRDWLFSRQRYWGEPFPILHSPDGQIIPLSEDDLPVELPEMQDFKPDPVSEDNQPPRPPLGRAPESWRSVERNGVTCNRELNTMPQWAGSCWYYLRYCDPHNDQQFIGSDAEKYWMGDTGVDLYVGGAEHAVLHLLYSRFWHHVLYDLDQVNTPEPYGKLFNQGYIQAYSYTDERGVYIPSDEVKEENGSFTYNGQPVNRQLGKMGKSLKNAITPDEIREQYGCDTLRLYEMYLGPLEQSKLWRTHDIVGVHRFLQRVWRNFVDDETGQLLVDESTPGESLERKLHITIKRVTDDMQRMSFHTAIAAMIELNNDLVALDKLPRQLAETFLLLLSPIAPHITEQLWQMFGHEQTLAYEPWPQYEESKLAENHTEYPVQVNGKLKGKVTIPTDADEETIERTALAHEKVRAAIGNLEIKKVVVVPGRMVNIVAK